MWVSVNSVLGMSERVSDLLVHFVLLCILLCMRLHSVRNKLYIYIAGVKVCLHVPVCVMETQTCFSLDSLSNVGRFDCWNVFFNELFSGRFDVESSAVYNRAVIRLEQAIFAHKLASSGLLYVYQTSRFWSQIKSAG